MGYRDLQYEQSNIGYNKQYLDGGIKCKNYELCKHLLPIDEDTWDYFPNYLCISCDMFELNKLEFRECNNECMICFTTDYKQVKFPTNCDHWFCVSCIKNILYNNKKITTKYLLFHY